MRRLLSKSWDEAEIAYLGRLLAKGYTITASARRLRRGFTSTYEKAYDNGYAVQELTSRAHQPAVAQRQP